MVDLHVHVALKGFDSVEDTRTCRPSKAEFEEHKREAHNYTHILYEFKRFGMFPN